MIQWFACLPAPLLWAGMAIDRCIFPRIAIPKLDNWPFAVTDVCFEDISTWFLVCTASRAFVYWSWGTRLEPQQRWSTFLSHLLTKSPKGETFKWQCVRCPSVRRQQFWKSWHVNWGIWSLYDPYDPPRWASLPDRKLGRRDLLSLRYRSKHVF